MTYVMVKVIKIPKGRTPPTYNETKSQSCVWNIDPGNIWRNLFKENTFYVSPGDYTCDPS